jgi:PucR C-terminal helix-turn-helix domain/GGDEF-like domain
VGGDDLVRADVSIPAGERALVTTRHRASLARVLDDLGMTLLDLVLGSADAAPEIGGVVVHDPYDQPVLPSGAVVLGVGVHDPAETATLLHDLGEAGAAALVVRAPVHVTDELRAAAADTGVALLGLTRGASWTQLVAMLRSLLAEDDVGAVTPEGLGGIPAGDLFAVANAVGALLDAPVTIEDPSSRVLAFSGRQEEADQGRIETIVGRQVPERYLRLLEERGVFRELYRSERPVYVDLNLPEVNVPRVALAVRGGDEILGFVWAAVREPLSPARERAFIEIGKLVALHMLRQRAGADVGRRLRTELVATALEGGPSTAEAVGRLGLSGRAAVVLAFALADEPASAPIARVEAARRWASDAFALHLSAMHPGSAAALVGGVTYGILPVTPERGDAEVWAERLAAEFLDRIGDRANGVIGIGRLAQGGAGLARSRADADRAVRVLRSGRSSRRVARAADVHVEALLLELGDLVATWEYEPAGPIGRLLGYDARHRTQLVPTLRAWLDALGDVPRAAAAVLVHPNTFRYRLRRLAEIAGLDLEDSEALFAAWLQLRLLGDGG